MTPAFSFALLAALVALAPGIHAAPAATSIPGLLAHQDDIIPLSPEEIGVFKPYTWYARTTACNLSAIMEGDCGTNCEANPTFKPIATGGDGDDTQFWFVSYDPFLDTIIVAHQANNFSDLWVCSGHYRCCPKGTLYVPNEAHTDSLTFPRCCYRPSGCCISPQVHLPSDVTMSYRGYSSPQVGNQAFEDYFDSLGMYAVRLNNKEDPVPVLPPITFFEYHHVSGEVHIKDDNVWVSCPGQDNPSDQCSTGDVTVYYNSEVSDHSGPFDGVTLGIC
ncbi:hypothetical protein GSI_12737 [Ganoderma sinense ZZ0214-1]|uniref:Fungal lipase-type domain-containing protein n=1 Tax=Ganoderma sinense ZZ0214-1 TaxID=1077348 RepID=A0A2G8RTL1_9APHY|nr:hypothetical protein GSI_12737 [Ganoderma sinense ZZ0214-1]